MANPIECKCSTFTFDNNRYLIQCSKCKDRGIRIRYLNTNSLNQNPIVPTWFNYHIIYIKENPHMQAYINLYSCIGLSIWIFLAFADKYNKINFKSDEYTYIRLFITIYLSSVLIVVLLYVDALNYLISNKYIKI